jgi:hypothetical protein
VLPPCCCLHSTPSPQTPQIKLKKVYEKTYSTFQHLPFRYTLFCAAAYPAHFTFTLQIHIVLCCSIPCPFYIPFPHLFKVELTIIFKGLIYIFCSILCFKQCRTPADGGSRFYLYHFFFEVQHPHCVLNHSVESEYEKQS